MRPRAARRPVPCAGELRDRRYARLLLVVVLAVYSLLFIRWSVADQIGAELSHAEGSLLLNSLSVAACVELDGRMTLSCLHQDGFVEKLQALYVVLVGPGSSVPMLPSLLLYLLGLAAIYLCAEKLANLWAGLLATATALTTNLFSLWVLSSESPNSPSNATAMGAFALVFLAAPLGSIRLPVAAGVPMGLTVSTHWLKGYYALLLIVLLACRTIAARGRARLWSRTYLPRWQP